MAILAAILENFRKTQKRFSVLESVAKMAIKKVRSEKKLKKSIYLPTPNNNDIGLMLIVIYGKNRQARCYVEMRFFSKAVLGGFRCLLFGS